MMFEAYMSFYLNLVMMCSMLKMIHRVDSSGLQTSHRSFTSHHPNLGTASTGIIRSKRSLHNKRDNISFNEAYSDNGNVGTASTGSLKSKRSLLAKRDNISLGQNYSGNGTENGESWTGGNCAFTKWPQPSGFGAVAMASNLWNSSEICGACLEITGPGGKFKGIVEDQCPSCADDSLDLDTSFWYQVSGGESPGIISITWEIVDCGFTTPIIFMDKTGSSADYTSIQVAGANTPVTALEVSTDGESTWVALERKSESNYFQPNDGKGLGSKGDIRVTCLSGKTFITKDVDLATPDTPMNGSANC